MKFLPYLFQLQAARKIHSFRGVALLAMEMGTGKTVVSLLHLQRHQELFPLVVVCPKSVKLQWQRECREKFGWDADIWDSSPSSWEKNSDIIIVNHDAIIDRKRGKEKVKRGCLESLLDLNPGLVILDEAQNFSNRKSKRTKAAKRLCDIACSVLLLSGTPISNRPSDLWSLLNILRPGEYSSFFKFGLEYCNGHIDENGYWDFKGQSKTEELRHHLLSTVMIRYRKEDILDQLPPLQRIVVPMEISDREEYDREAITFVKKLKKGGMDQQEKKASLFHLKHLVGQAKVSLVIEWVENFLEGGDGKLIVFGVHRDVIDPVYQHFRSQSVIIHGDITGEDRQRAVDQFQTNPNTRLCVGNLQAAGVGLTLTAAHDILFAEVGWKPSDLTQAEQRAFARLNDIHGINAWYLIAQSTIEERLLELNQQKQQVANAILDGGDVEEPWDVYDLLCQQLMGEITS